MLNGRYNNVIVLQIMVLKRALNGYMINLYLNNHNKKYDFKNIWNSPINSFMKYLIYKSL